VSIKILLLGNYRHTITVVRSLGRAGFDVILGRENDVSEQYSRFCSETWVHPKLEGNPEEFGTALDEFVERRPDVSVVFPIGESPLVFLNRNAGRYSTLTVVSPAPSTVFTCLDKVSSYDSAKRAGIPVPDWLGARCSADLIAAGREIGYPCIIKPNGSHHFFFGKKAIVCRSQVDVTSNFHEWPEGNESLIVQRYVESDRPNCHFRAIDGKLVEYFEHMVVRTDRIDETGFEIDGISVRPTAILREYCAALIGELNYTGVGCIQFLVDRGTGTAYFLEINPRLDATCALPYAIGVDFPLYAVNSYLADRRPTNHINGSYPEGVRIHYLMGDLQGLAYGLKDRSISPRDAIRWMYRIGESLLSAKVHLTFQWTDPLPTVRLYANLLKVFRRRTFRRQTVPSQQRPDLVK
jgi:predicted ATP-grasp superfamily ATP-dependent carboligase